MSFFQVLRMVDERRDGGADRVEMAEERGADERQNASQIPFSRRQLIRGVGVGVLTTTFSGEAVADRSRRYIVGTSSNRDRRAARSRADQVHRELDFGAIGQAVVGRFSRRARTELQRRDGVRYVEPDGTVEAIGETLPWGIDRVDADVVQVNGTTGQGADIAIIDSGIDSDHPDLSANLGTGYAAVSCNPDYVDCNQSWDDDNDHGTHCAGIADAVDNSEGVRGISTEATLHAVKVLDGWGSGSWSDVAEGIRWVADQGYDVGSLSLGASSSSQTLKDACQYAYDKGVLLVAAAGNDGDCTDCVLYPAKYSTVMAISATNQDDGLASFSSTGPEIELAAPGKGIYSTEIGGYTTMSGTSMACPHVSGAGGMLMANGYTNTEARNRLTQTAEDIGLASNEQGSGLLDVEAAIGSSDTSVAVSTSGASNVGETSATLNGSLDDLGGASSADVYFRYRQAGASSWTTSSTQTLSSTGSFSVTVSSMQSGTDYEFYAIAEASDGDADTGATVTFTTQSSDTSVAVATDGTSTVGETSATLAGSLTDLGGASSADVSFEWRERGTSSWASTSVQTLSSTGSYSEEITGLSGGTDYEFRAAADASDGDSDVGSTLTFTTDSSTGSTGPSIDSYSVTEAGSPNPHAEITADWAVSDADADLDGVRVEVYDARGTLVDSSRTGVSGSSASGTDTFKLKHRNNETFDVMVTVTDAAGTTASQTATVDS